MVFNDDKLFHYIIENEGNTIENIKEIVDLYYDLGKVVEVKKLDIGNSNFNYFVTTEKGGRKVKYFAQLFSTSKTIKALKYELALREHYIRNNKSALECAEVYLTKNGGYTVACECTDIGMVRYFCMFTFLEGISQPREDWDGGKISKELICGCAKGIARYHVGAYGFTPPEDCESIDVSYEDELKNYRYVFTEEFERCRKESDFEYYDYFGEYQPKLLEILDRYTQIYLEAKDDLPECICHMDTSPQNYLFDANYQPVGICDLDISKKGPRLFDIAWFINEGLCRFDPDKMTNSIDPDNVAIFLDAYDEEIEALGLPVPGKLTDTERDKIMDFFPLVSIMCGFYYIWDYILHGNTTNSSDYYMYWGNWTKTIMEYLECHMDEFKSRITCKK